MDDIQERIIFVKKAYSKNDHVGIPIPKELNKVLNYKIGDRLSMCIDKGKYGIYLAVWLDPAEQKVPESESDEDEPEKISIQEI